MSYNVIMLEHALCKIQRIGVDSFRNIYKTILLALIVIIELVLYTIMEILFF